MADSIVQSDTNDAHSHGDHSNGNKPATEQIEQTEQATSSQGEQAVETVEAVVAVAVPAVSTPHTIIWTPRFIVIFALALVVGLTAESTFTLGWTLHLILPTWVLLGHVVLVACCLSGILRVTRSAWSRLGSIFGWAWAIFTSINLLLITFVTLAPTSPVPAYVNVAIASALLGMYICLSLERTPLTRWDGWFFGIALLVSLGVLFLTYFLMPSTSRSLATVDSDLAATELVLSVLVWWVRPSCWQAQPGTTLFLGLTPTILLLLAIPSLGRETNFFLTQVMFLSLILGLMRVWQGELRRKQVGSVPSLQHNF